MGKFNRLIQKALLALITFYRRYLVHLKVPTCKYQPSCPQYSYDAIKKYGPYKGLYLTLKRVIKCNPFSRGGYDPLQ